MGPSIAGAAGVAAPRVWAGVLRFGSLLLAWRRGTGRRGEQWYGGERSSEEHRGRRELPHPSLGCGGGYIGVDLVALLLSDSDILVVVHEGARHDVDGSQPR